MKDPAHRRGRTIRVLLLALAAGTCLAAGPAMAANEVLVTRLEPTEGNKLIVQQLAPPKFGEEGRWEVKIDAWLKNSSTNVVVVGYVEVTVKVGGVQQGYVYRPWEWVDLDTDGEFDPDEKLDVRIPPGGTKVVFIRSAPHFLFPLPIANAVDVVIPFELEDPAGGGTPPPSIPLTFSPQRHLNPTPTAGYLPPFRRSDLKPGEYWFQGFHADNNTYQPFSYDLGVWRFDPDDLEDPDKPDGPVGRWVAEAIDESAPGETKPTLDGTQNWHSLTYGKPLYAMADGEVVACGDGVLENPRGTPLDNVPGGGNMLWIRHGNEFALYAHLKDDTIPDDFCPFNDGTIHAAGNPTTNAPGDEAFMVKAGTKLGLIGNSGSSGGPHTHIHVQKGLPVEGWGGTLDDSLPRPFNFTNVDVQPFVWYNDLVPEDFGTLNQAGALPYNTLINPDSCGVAPPTGGDEWAFNALPESCLQSVINVASVVGWRPTWIDGYNIGSSNFFNIVLRPADVTWDFRFGLTSAQYQSAVDDLVNDKGYRLFQVETYRRGTEIRYAAIFTDEPGPPFVAYHDRTQAQHDALVADLTGDGFRPVNVSPTTSAGVTRYAALFEKVDVGAFVLDPDLAIGDYAQAVEDYLLAGRQVVYVNAWTDVVGQTRYSTIFNAATKGAHKTRDGLSISVYQAEWEANLASGRLTRNVTGYTGGTGAPAFTAVWRVPPETTITAAPAEFEDATSAAFAFAASVPGGSFECSLDGAAFSTCSSPYEAKGLAAETHTFAVRSLDRERVRDLTPAVRTWTIDLSPPVVTILKPAGGDVVEKETDLLSLGDAAPPARELPLALAVNGALLEARAVDAESGIADFRFRIDGDVVDPAEVFYDAEDDVYRYLWDKPEGPGMHTIEALAVNNVDLVGSDSVSVGMVIVDLQAP